MKRSHTQGNRLLRNDDGSIYGVVLAADYCGQHEMGISHIHSIFGMKGGDTDFGGHTAGWDASDRIQVMDISHERKEGRRKVMDNGVAITTGRPDADMLAHLLRRYDDAAFIGAWDDGDFAIAGYDEDGRLLVSMIHEGIALQDIAIWIGGTGSNPFKRGGLVIARPSLTPQPLIDTFNAAQAERRALAAAAEETGIRDRIIAARSSPYRPSIPFYALSPSWTHEARKGDTEHPVMFFLNPADSSRHNHGWFTVEELDQWIKGDGPVMKEKV